MQTPKALFICKANVGRSQIAESIYNHIYGKGRAISLAGWEARKEKYHGKPEQSIVQFMKSFVGLDISDQHIKYLSDIPERSLENIKRVIFLYDPTLYASCDKECMRNGVTPYEYFQNKNIPIKVCPVSDPFETGEHGYENIYKQISTIIKELT